MASNEETIRNLYAVAEKEPKRFRSLFTENGYWWDVPAGVTYRGDEVARAADIYSAAFPDMHRELSDLYFGGNVVVVQLSLNGTHDRLVASTIYRENSAPTFGPKVLTDAPT